ncbi:MAG: hypothetical protein ACTSXF_03755, partial [Promethearchaeota archaeon]
KSESRHNSDNQTSKASIIFYPVVYTIFMILILITFMELAISAGSDTIEVLIILQSILFCPLLIFIMDDLNAFILGNIRKRSYNNALIELGASYEILIDKYNSDNVKKSNISHKKSIYINYFRIFYYIGLFSGFYIFILMDSGLIYIATTKNIVRIVVLLLGLIGFISNIIIAKGLKDKGEELGDSGANEASTGKNENEKNEVSITKEETGDKEGESVNLALKVIYNNNKENVLVAFLIPVVVFYFAKIHFYSNMMNRVFETWLFLFMLILGFTIAASYLFGDIKRISEEDRAKAKLRLPEIKYFSMIILVIVLLIGYLVSGSTVAPILLLITEMIAGFFLPMVIIPAISPLIFKNQYKLDKGFRIREAIWGFLTNLFSTAVILAGIFALSNDNTDFIVVFLVGSLLFIFMLAMFPVIRFERHLDKSRIK